LKNVVVTGAEGKLGNYVVDELINHGYNVIELIRSSQAEQAVLVILNMSS